MAVALEALAMAGVDCSHCSITIEEWERATAINVLNPPPHLLAPAPQKKKKKISKKDTHFPVPFGIPTSHSKVRTCDEVEGGGGGGGGRGETAIEVEEEEGFRGRKEKKARRTMRSSIAMLIKRMVRKVSLVFRMATRKRKETFPAEHEHTYVR